MGCSPWGHKESDTTRRLHFHFHALEKEMATHFSILAWKIPWTKEPGGLQSIGSLRVRQDLVPMNMKALPYLHLSAALGETRKV